MKIIYKNILIVMLLTLVSNIQLISQETKFTFNSINKIDFCSNQSAKEILVTLEIGEIKSEDNLESISFEIEYDMSQFKFDFVLTSNTLLDQFEVKDYSIVNSEGLILIDAGNTTIGKKVTGNKLFLAISGKYIGKDCINDGFIRVNRVLFNDEYIRKIVVNQNYYIETIIDTKTAGNYQLSKNIDTLLFDSLDVKKDLEVNVSFDRQFEYLVAKFPKNINQTYSINDIKINNIDYILAKNITEDSLEIKITKKIDTKIEAFNLIFEINKNSLDTNTYQFDINNFKFNECNCNINEMKNLPFISQIKYNKDTNDTTGVVINRNKNIYSITKGILKINNTDYDLKYLKIWTIEGQILHNFNISDINNLIINLEQEKNKVLILQFIYKDNTYYTDKVIIQS